MHDHKASRTKTQLVQIVSDTILSYEKQQQEKAVCKNDTESRSTSLAVGLEILDTHLFYLGNCSADLVHQKWTKTKMTAQNAKKQTHI